MHRIATKDSPEDNNFEIIEQTSSPIVFLTAADTDIQTLAYSIQDLPNNFPSLRVLNLLRLQQQFSIDDYADRILIKAQVIILRILGGVSYWSYGLEVVKEIVEKSGAVLFVLPGDDQDDPQLMSHSTISLDAVNQLWRYFIEGGKDNLLNGLKFISDCCFATNYNPPLAQIIPKIGIWRQEAGGRRQEAESVGIIFYRSHYLSGNLAPIEALCQALKKRHLSPIAIYISSLRDPQVQAELLTILKDVQLILNTTSFSLAQLGKEETTPLLWKELNLPILQVILSSSKEPQWQNNTLGLMPSDLAMNVVLPEVDGRIITRAISFKAQQNWHPQLETDIIIYEPKQDRVDFVADLTMNWLKLKNTPIQERKVALILANYPCRDGRIANGVGLDTPQSCVEILQALSAAGYYVQDLPIDGDDLIKKLIQGVTNDPETGNIRSIYQSLSATEYLEYFKTLPPNITQAITQRWGIITSPNFPLSGLQFGNVFVGIQPSRGYEKDPNLNYHAPDLEPTHQYLAYYYWLKHSFQAQAIVHVGKHGNLEWLPGKGVALSQECYPEIALGTLPHFYPFIVNDPGEGTQAKRRASAVILDHLTPPMTRAELYGDLQRLETLIDEYYQAESLDPKRLKAISAKITQLLKSTHLEKDVNLPPLQKASFSSFLTSTDAYLCELKEAQIRDGLHILGRCPTGTQLRDLILAIARFPTWQRKGLTPAIALDFNLDLNPLTTEKDLPFIPTETTPALFKNCRINGDIVTVLEDYATGLIEQVIAGTWQQDPNLGPLTYPELEWISNSLLPALYKSTQEITYLLAGLNGHYVPAGASGAPTRGRPDVLPTGRNFYSVDIRSIPTETAWDMGRKAAEVLIERYTQEHGEYPKTLAISIWGTATMRNGGEDFSQILALLGVKPIWDGPSRRVVDFEILTPSALGRPRVDVTVRVSGFFRDSFPSLLQLVYKIFSAVSSLKEEKEINPLAAQVEADTAFWENQGLTKESANLRAKHRIFGSKPGSYGAGLQGLIDAQNWNNEEDLARAYLNWSSYAYSTSEKEEIIGTPEAEAFKQRLSQVEIVLHNQDNREHDLLDSDDYYQFQGGLAVAIKALTGKRPEMYFGDNSVLSQPRVKKLSEEIAKVYRARVINPKWLAGVMRHGYKGAFEIAATVDYLFAYDATTGLVEDYMYEGITEAYLREPQVSAFIEEKNPHALRDIAERLLEAHQRGLWENVKPEILQELKAIVHRVEGIIEGITL